MKQIQTRELRSWCVWIWWVHYTYAVSESLYDCKWCL